MMQTSTPVTKPLTEAVNSEVAPQELSEEDEQFLGTIRQDLAAMEVKPSAATIKAILNYSKSL